jgi:hypothetical protein
LFDASGFVDDAKFDWDLIDESGVTIPVAVAESANNYGNNANNGYAAPAYGGSGKAAPPSSAMDANPPMSMASGAAVYASQGPNNSTNLYSYGGGGAGAASGEDPYPLSRVMSKSSTAQDAANRGGAAGDGSNSNGAREKPAQRKSIFTTIRHSLFGHKVKDSTAR